MAGYIAPATAPEFFFVNRESAIGVAEGSYGIGAATTAYLSLVPGAAADQGSATENQVQWTCPFDMSIEEIFLRIATNTADFITTFAVRIAGVTTGAFPLAAGTTGNFPMAGPFVVPAGTLIALIATTPAGTGTVGVRGVSSRCSVAV